MNIENIIKEIKELNLLDDKSIGERFIKFNEEFGEFSAEVGKLVGITHKEFDKEHLKEEMADFIQNSFALSLHAAEIAEIDIEEIFNIILIKNEKWRNKIPQYTNLKNS